MNASRTNTNSVKTNKTNNSTNTNNIDVYNSVPNLKSKMYPSLINESNYRPNLRYFNPFAGFMQMDQAQINTLEKKLDTLQSNISEEQDTLKKKVLSLLPPKKVTLPPLPPIPYPMVQNPFSKITLNEVQLLQKNNKSKKKKKKKKRHHRHSSSSSNSSSNVSKNESKQKQR